MTRRRDFPTSVIDEIRQRATDANGILRCEGCSLDLTGKPSEIDHIIAEAHVPEWKKTERLTAKDGQLLGHCCHRGEDGKTARDVKIAAKIKRQGKRHAGLKKAQGKLQGPGFPKAEKERKTVMAVGMSEIQRRFQRG